MSTPQSASVPQTQPPIPMFAPDGTVRQIPPEQSGDAIAAGGKIAVPMVDPQGVKRYIPHDQILQAQQAGGKVDFSDDGSLSTWQAFKDRMPGGADLLHAAGLPGSVDEAKAKAAEIDAHPFSSSLSAASPVPALKSLVNIPVSMGKEEWRGIRGMFSSDPTEQMEAPLHFASGMNPLSAPITNAMSEQGLGTPQANATGVVGAGTLAATEVLPRVIPPVARGVTRTGVKVINKALSPSAVGAAGGAFAGPLGAAAGSELMPELFPGWAARAKEGIIPTPGWAAKPTPQMDLFRNTPKLGDAPAAAVSPLDRPVVAAADSSPSTLSRFDFVGRRPEPLLPTPMVGDQPATQIMPFKTQRLLPPAPGEAVDAAATETQQPLRGITSDKTIASTPLYTPEQVAQFRQRFPSMTDAEINDAIGADGKTANQKFNQYANERDQLFKNGATNSDPAFTAANERASLYQHIEQARANQSVAPTPPARGVASGKTAPYIPGSAMEPAPFLTFHGATDGESAALMQLTHTGGAVLRKIAQARGLKIPAAADNVSIINKIQGDLSPEEIQSFSDAAKARAGDRAASLQNVDPAIVEDNKAIAQKLYDKADEMQAAGESPYRIRSWRTAGESIETRPTAVRDILNNPDQLKTIRGVDNKMAQHIQEVTGSQPPAQPNPQAGPAAPAQAPRGVTQPFAGMTPQVATGDNLEDLFRQSLDAIDKAKKPPGSTPASAAPPAGGFSTAPRGVTQEQGGHAGGGVASVEELNRPGVNYVVNKSGGVTYQGKPFDPGSTPSGSTHVTVLPDGSFRVNAGQQLTATQEAALRKAVAGK